MGWLDRLRRRLNAWRQRRPIFGIITSIEGHRKSRPPAPDEPKWILQAYGMDANRAERYAAVLQRTALVFGYGNSSDLTFIVGRAFAAGRITQQSRYQLIYRGIDVDRWIGEGLDWTGQQVRDAIEAGGLTADDALEALIVTLDARFGDYPTERR